MVSSVEPARLYEVTAKKVKQRTADALARMRVTGRLKPARSHQIAVGVATVSSLVLGLAFIFVRSPLPWGWDGIDHYHDRALSIANGHGYPTMDYPVGYSLFLAAFYKAFGDHPAIPLVAQVMLNALIPWMMYRIVKPLIDGRTAALTALLVGVFSFNTIYAATQVSDSVCNVAFAAGIFCFAIACHRDRVGWFAIAGGLFAVASQFRPNLILFPFVAAAMAFHRSGVPLRRVGRAVAIVGVTVAVCLPWTVRNYRLTGEFLPASTRGAVQLWYGTLQVGP